jgi:hypothetical protein
VERQRPWRLAAVAAAIASSAAVARALETIPWQAAAEHVGQRVTVEGTVVATRSLGRACVLQFAPDDPTALTVQLVIPFISDLPPHPEVFYRNKQVHVTGVIGSYRGRPEMVIRGSGQIAVVGAAASPTDAGAAEPGSAETGARPASEEARERTAPAQSAPAAAAPGPTGGPATAPEAAAVARTGSSARRPEVTAGGRARAPAGALPEPRGPGTESPAPPAAPAPAAGAPAASVIGRLSEARALRCAAARARWREVRPQLDAALSAMARCVAGDGYRCREETDRLYTAMAKLDEVQADVDATCP